MLATIVDWAALAKTAWVSAVIGLGILVVAAIGVAASLRAQDDRNAGAGGAAVMFGTALVYSGEGAERALELAGIRDRFDTICCGPREAATIEEAFATIGVTPDRDVVVDVVPAGLTAAREAGVLLAIAIARSSATPAELRNGGAQSVVADLQELLGPTS